jgi:hypothetical protein
MKISKALGGRMVNRTDRTLRNWAARGLIPRELTDSDLPRLREVSKAQPVRGRPPGAKNRPKP